MMKEIIKSVLEKFGTQTNLGSESARERIADEIEKALEQSDNYLYEDQGDGHMIKVDSESDSWKCEICNKSTYDLDSDYIGKGTNHLSCEIRLEQENKLQKQIYNELTSDGLPSGGDAQAVLESHKLAEEIVGKNDLGYIFESPDGGETIYRRKVGESEREIVSKKDWKEYNRNR